MAKGRRNRIGGPEHHAFGTDIAPTVRPVPYYGTAPIPGERELARSLRGDFLALFRRRLPWHHLCGLPHGAAPRFVALYRKTHPYFLRSDIRSVYPSVRHQDLVVGVQLAYRDLLGLSYVPSGFKKRYLSPLVHWCESLPLRRGIPLGSALSAIAAPLMLVPLWLELRRRFDVPVMVFMDDVLVCCRDPQQCVEAYAFLENRLHDDFDLAINTDKSVSGCFASDTFTFCGWRFAGGCAVVSDAKLAGFEERLRREAGRGSGRTPRALIKRINRLVNGFGHYYKYGNVKRQYERLDVLVRTLVRRRLSREGYVGRIYNEDLERLGLRSFRSIREGAGCRHETAATKLRPVRRPILRQRTVDVPAPPAMEEELIGLLQRIDRKLTSLVSSQREMIAAIDRLRTGW